MTAAAAVHNSKFFVEVGTRCACMKTTLPNCKFRNEDTTLNALPREIFKSLIRPKLADQEFLNLSLVCFKWLTVHRANVTHLRLGMWEEIVDDSGVIPHTPTTTTTTTTTKRIPPPPLVGWFPSVRTLHIGPKFIQGWELAEYNSPGQLALERVAMPKEVHQMVMDLLAVQPLERLEEVHFDCFYVDDVAPPLLDVLSTRFSESLRVLTLNEHSVNRRQKPSMKLVESLAKFPSLRALHISWDKYCEHSFEYGTPEFLIELGIKVLDLCERIPCLEELAIPLPLRYKASPWEWDFSSFKQLTRLIFSERSSNSDILHDFLSETLQSSEQIKTFISQMPPQVGINVEIQSHTKASVNKPQIETVLWECALSFAGQFRSLIAGQDPLRVLKETDWDFHCEARYLQGQGRVSVTQRRDYCSQFCAEVTRLIPKERRQELLKSDIEFLRFLLTWPAAKLFRRWPDEWNRENIEQSLAALTTTVTLSVPLCSGKA